MYWKKIDDYIAVSRDGLVKTLPRVLSNGRKYKGTILIPHCDKNGYQYCTTK